MSGHVPQERAPLIKFTAGNILAGMGIPWVPKHHWLGPMGFDMFP